MKYTDIALKIIGINPGTVINIPDPCRYADQCRAFTITRKECQEYDGDNKTRCYISREIHDY